MDGSRRARSGAVASTASGHHCADRRSIRFVPDASPGSTGASCPASSDARNELTRWMRPVRAYASGSPPANLRICGPVKRSNAREPVRAASTDGPPTAAAIAAHSAVVLESIQIGATGRESSGSICAASGCAASSEASPAPAPSARYTLPCCCAEPEIAARRPMSTSHAARRAIIRSSASAHMTGDDTATAGSTRGSTPCSVPYCGSTSSKAMEVSTTTRASSAATSMRTAVRLCVLESSPR